MDVRVSAEAADPAGELESLRDWLADMGEFRGRVAAVESPPPPGALGPVLDAVLISLGPGGAAAAFATAVVSWLRQRRGAVKIEIELPDGASVKVEATVVRELGVTELRPLLESVATTLDRARDGSRE